MPLSRDGLTDVVTSHRVSVGGIELHAVVGFNGPPPLLLPGWPQFRDAWREAMTPLASRHTGTAADLRGMGARTSPDRSMT